MRISKLLRIAVAAVVMAAAFPAFALVDQKDIIAAVNAKDYAAAERLVRQNLAEKPNSARYHYELGQILGFQGRHSAAADELIQARKLDPSLGFARSAADFTAKLEHEVSLSAAEKAPAPPAQTTAPKPPVAATPAPAPQPRPAPAPAPAASAKPESSLGWLWILLGLAAVGGVGFMIYRRNAVQRGAAERTQRAREQMARLLPMSQKLDDAGLTARASAHADEVKAQIAARIDALTRQINSAIETVRGGTPLDNSTLMELSRDVDSIGAWAATGINPDAPRRSSPTPSSFGTPASGSGSSPASHTPSHTRFGGSTAGSAPVHHHHHHGSTQQPVVINNGSDGFLTGMVAGSLLNGGGHHERVVERVVEREVPRYEPRPEPRYSSFDAGRDDDERDKRVSSFDAGRDDTPVSSFDAGSDNT